MTIIEKLFRISWNWSPYDVLKNARDSITNTNFYNYKNFEELMNSWYYPKQQTTMSTALQDFQERFLQHHINENLIPEISGLQLNKELGLKLKGQKMKIDATRMQMQIGTFLTRYQQIYLFLDSLNAKGINITSNEGIDFVNRATTLRDDMLNFMANNPQYFIGTKDTQFLSIRKEQSLANLFPELDLIYNTMLTGANIASLLGDSFEAEAAPLQILLNRGIENVKNRQIRSLILSGGQGGFAKSETGKKMVSRTNNSMFQAYVQLDENDWTTSKDDKGNEYNQKKTITINGCTADISNELRNDKAKVDFIWTIGKGQQLKSSMKRWSRIDNTHNFGKTDLYGAMLRAVNMDAPLSYGLVIGYYGPQNKLGGQYAGNTTNLHNFAKACILVDTLMGVSQGNLHRADTLIIDDQASKRIRVIPIVNILNSVLERENLLKYVGAGKDNSKDFVSEVTKHISLYNENSKKINITSLHSTMNAIKLQVSAGILNDPAMHL